MGWELVEVDWGQRALDGRGTHSNKENEEDKACEREDQDGHGRDLDLWLAIASNSTVSELHAAAGEVCGNGGHAKDEGGRTGNANGETPQERRSWG